MAREDTQNQARAALSCVFVCRLNHTETPRPNGTRWLASHGSCEAEEVKVAVSAVIVGVGKKKRVRMMLEPYYDGDLFCLGSDLETIMSDHRVLLGHPDTMLRMLHRGAEFAPPPPRRRTNHRHLLLEAVAFVLAVFDAEPANIQVCHIFINRERETITPDDRALAVSYGKYERTHFSGVSTGKAPLELTA